MSANAQPISSDRGNLHPRCVPHLLAGMVLLLFAILHVAALFVDVRVLRDYNPLFPFARNRVLHVGAALLEVALASLCYRWRGRNRADACILWFIGIMLWYRLGLQFTAPSEGGCGCTGVLAPLLGLTPRQEQCLSLFALFILAGLILLGRWVRTRLKPSSSLLTWILVGPVLFPGSMSHAESLEIRGTYQYADYNPKTGGPYHGQEGRFAFSAILSGVQYRISATNSANPNVWSELVFDGTNTLHFVPHSEPFVSKSETDTVFLTISPSPTFLNAAYDAAYIVIPWLTYGLSPATVPPDKRGFRPLPLPWENPRRNPQAYGWNWAILPSDDNRFVLACKVLREPALDLKTEKRELLRMELDYPRDIEAKNHYLRWLEHRRATPKGCCAMDFRSSCHLSTNQIAVPVESDLQVWMYPHGKFPAVRASLHADAVMLKHETPDVLGRPNGTVVVNDYRYKKVKGRRVFRCAEYTLRTGDIWKGDSDPVLLREVDYALEHGPTYDLYDYTIRHVVLWMAGAVFLLGPLFVALRFKTPKTGKETRYK